MLKQMSSQLSNEAKDNIDGNKQNESKYSFNLIDLKNFLLLRTFKTRTR